MFRTIDTNGNVKYSGRSKAAVLDNRDPLNRGRIIVDHPLLGETVWIDYLKSPGQFNVPSIGDVVYVEADAGHQEFPIAHGNGPVGEDANPDTPAIFKRDVPTNRGWMTPGGHAVELDDGIATVTDAPNDKAFTTSKRGIRITSTAGNRIHIIEDSDAGNQYILLQDAGGNLIKLDYKNNTLTVHSIGKTNIETTSDHTETIGGKLAINVTGDCTITAANVDVTSNGHANVTASGNAVVTAAEIHLNGSSGQVLTTVTDPVVDTIFGAPTVGVPTVKSG